MWKLILKLLNIEVVEMSIDEKQGREYLKKYGFEFKPECNPHYRMIDKQKKKL